MHRLMLFSNLGNPIGEISPNDVFSLERRETINGEHSLEITTTQVLEKYSRLLCQDGRGYWREYVVAGIDEEHTAGRRIVGTYYCVWSVQSDLLGVVVSKMPDSSASEALTDALSSQKRWKRGTVTNLNTASASMYDMSAWKALGVLLENWGGELDTTITVGENGVISRSVDLYSQMGEDTPKRRYDFGADMRSVKRSMPDEPFYCRVSPRGKGESTEGGGYGRKIRITEVNGGKDYLEYSPMVAVSKLPDGYGGYEYPTLIIENSDCETPQALKDWALSVYVDMLTPKVTYEVDVVQAAIEGVDMQGVSLGDVVQLVDRYFTDDGLRLEGRVTSLVVDEINERNQKVTIGYIGQNLSNRFSDLAGMAQSAIEANFSLRAELATSVYLEELIERLNEEINSDGGYTYIVPGNGIRTYDTAVSDPLVGSEASKVVEIKGGSIRIANSRTAQGEWEWKSVFTSGHIAAELITSAYITSGFIGSANGRVYFDLDNNVLRCDQMVSTDTDNHIVADIGTSTFDPNTYIPAMRIYNTANKARAIIIMPGDANSHPIITSRYASMVIQTTTQQGGTGRDTGKTGLWICSNGVSVLFGQNAGTMTEAEARSTTNTAYLGRVLAFPRYTGSGTTYNSDGRIFIMGTIAANYGTSKFNSIEVANTKSRRATTDDYGERLLYCYETPSPMFGDIGSGKTDENGLCVVSIDDIFAETVRTDYDYQVFLQKRGEGDIWVEDKKPGYFVVSGTPNIQFDWELKARQSGFETLRIDDGVLKDIAEQEQRNDYIDLIEDTHQSLYQYEEEIEGLYNEAAI